MGKKVLDTITAEFNMLTEGRQYSGNHRSYLVDNAMKVVDSEATKERIAIREAFGYYGHGFRKLAKKMNLEEIEPVRLPNGQTTVIHAVPSNLTTGLTVSKDGVVKHSQDILDTDSGQLVSRLNGSHVGGFSWACSGVDRQRRGISIMTGFSGMDYVLQPNFTANRGYILESVSNEDFILESVSKVVGDDKVAEQLVSLWQMDAVYEAEQLRSQIEDATAIEVELTNRLHEKDAALESKTTEFDDLSEQMKAAVASQEAEREYRNQLVEFISEKAPFFIPENIKHAMLENDFTKATGLFESAQQFHFESLPLSASNHSKGTVIDTGRMAAFQEPEADSVDAIFAVPPL
jgi:hypothetical protein